MALIQIDQGLVQERSGFVSKVYTLLGVSLLFCCLGAFLGLSMPVGLYMPLVIIQFVMLLACSFLQRAYPLNLFLLFGFTAVSGMTLGPVLSSYVARGAGDAIPVATAITAVTFGGLSAYVNISKKDFSFLGGFLFVGLIIMLLYSLAAMFLPAMPFNSLIYSGFGVLLFCGFILVDTSRMLHRYGEQDYVAATLGLYLDIVNLFLFVLRLVGGGNNRR